MTRYSVNVSVNVRSLPEEGKPDYNQSNVLYHAQVFEIEGEKFSDVAPTIDGIYSAIHQVVEANGGHSY